MKHKGIVFHVEHLQERDNMEVIGKNVKMGDKVYLFPNDTVARVFAYNARLIGLDSGADFDRLADFIASLHR